jgi:hypothetical protein
MKYVTQCLNMLNGKINKRKATNDNENVVKIYEKTKTKQNRQIVQCS